MPDRDLFAWITERETTPANYDTPILRALKSFHLGGDHRTL